MKALILGGSGMLGHKLWKRLTSQFETYATFRSAAADFQRLGIFEESHAVTGVHAEDFDSVKVEICSVMNVEKFVDAGSIAPIYYDTGYFLAPDGRGSEDVYAVLREAIANTGKVALSRVVISQRERTIALRPMGPGLVAHTPLEERDLNSPRELFEDAAKLKTEPEMVMLATQLIERQTAPYDPAYLEDRYETRLRAMIDAKLHGEGLQEEVAMDTDRTNVVDLMAALRKSVGQATPEAPPPKPGKPTGKKAGGQAAERPSRKRA